MDLKEETTNRGRKIGYVRVSDHDQTEHLQLDALEAAGCHVVYGDLGVSGAKITRKGLTDVLADLETRDTLVVWKLDRLGRSAIHLNQILIELRNRGVFFQALTQGIDTNNAAGRMLYGLLAVFAEFEREQISDRTKAGMAAAKKRGKHVGRPRLITAEQARKLAREIKYVGTPVTELARRIGVSPQTLVRAIHNTRGLDG
ncbi:recombinase family protein [Shimia sp. R9_2]|uniref:recombinase family protein n=1 Tax=Shimia sp. R9_2 TaxID=2821112 RepID=UPI001AD9B5F1|nr:recombinase family protein [Shimia sp. R9_2]MBO9399130.1 recombinase family protein [Shimia sp. R9_2]